MKYENYTYKTKDVINYLSNYKHDISHLVVLHTDIRPISSYTTSLSPQFIDNIGQHVRWFKNRLNQTVGGKKAIKNSSSQLLFIPTLEGTQDIGDEKLTCHLNLALGRLPDWLKDDDLKLKAILQESWLKAGCLNIHSNRKLNQMTTEQLFVERVKSTADADRWINYILKEGINSWDVCNTQLPKI